MKKTGNKYLVQEFGEKFVVEEFVSDEIKEPFFMKDNEFIFPDRVICNTKDYDIKGKAKYIRSEHSEVNNLLLQRTWVRIDCWRVFKN